MKLASYDRRVNMSTPPPDNSGPRDGAMGNSPVGDWLKEIPNTPVGKGLGSQQSVEDHFNSDLDTHPHAQHHTLGKGRHQAAPGDHNHQDTAVLFIKDRFPSVGTFTVAPAALNLSHVPMSNSLHLYKNKNTILEEISDYSILTQELDIVSGSAAIGDFLTARYASRGIVSINGTTLIQVSNLLQWPASAAPPPSKTVTFSVPVAVGDLVAVAISFGADALTTVSGCGVSSWNIIQSFGTSGQNFTAAIAWCIATSAGSTVTINFNTGFGINGGSAIGWQLHGVSSLINSGTTSTVTGPSSHQTPPLSASGGQVYIGVTCMSAGGAHIGYTETPGFFDSTADVDSTDNNTWLDTGLRISRGIETISRTTIKDGGTSGLSAAALFG